MNDHIEIVPVFPTPVYFAICPNDIQESIKYLDSAEIDNEKDKGVRKEYGVISKDTYILNRPECAPLKEWIMGHVNNYCKNVRAWVYDEIQMTQSWVSIKYPNEKHTYHQHPNSLVSGVFYWHDEPIEAISFLRPPGRTNIEITRDETKDAPYAFDHHNFSPLKKTLILFPSELQHGVPENSSPLPRKSVAFNTFIFEKIGSKCNLTELSLPSNRYL